MDFAGFEDMVNALNGVQVCLPAAVDATERAMLWTGMCEIPADAEVKVEVIDGSGEVCATITHSGDTITVDRLDGNPVSAPLDDEDEDHYSVRLFLSVFADTNEPSGLPAKESMVRELVREMMGCN